MAEVYLAGGAMVECSIEDLDLARDFNWRVWVLKELPRAVRDAQSRGRRFRLHLHREVAFQIHPELRRTPYRLSVKPINGNFLDVRRENLEITVKARARGGVRRPAGFRARPYLGAKPGNDPPAWARSAGEAVRDD